MSSTFRNNYSVEEVKGSSGNLFIIIYHIVAVHCFFYSLVPTELWIMHSQSYHLLSLIFDMRWDGDFTLYNLSTALDTRYCCLIIRLYLVFSISYARTMSFNVQCSCPRSSIALTVTCESQKNKKQKLWTFVLTIWLFIIHLKPQSSKPLPMSHRNPRPGYEPPGSRGPGGALVRILWV